MTNTTTLPLTVNGVRLDTLGYNVETLDGRNIMPRQRYATQVVPGKNGVVVDFEDAYDVGQLIIKMWVIGRDVNGAVTAASERAEFEKNLDTLWNLFGRRGSTLSVQQTMADGRVMQCDAVVTDIISPTMFAENSGRFSVAMDLPDSVWYDVTIPSDFTLTNAANPTSINVTTLTGATAPIDDGRFLVTGPIANPRIIEKSTGEYAQLSRTLAAGETWLFDVGTRAVRYGTAAQALTLNSTDTAGSSDIANLSFTGRFKFFVMRPFETGSGRMPQLQLTGTGTTAATAIAVRARRKYL
jgi:hypothetical protein